MRLVLLILVAAVVLAGATIYVASEYGGEVVTLRTSDASGVHETHLWLVTMERELFLRAGDRGSQWLTRLRQNPQVELVRDGQVTRYQAIPAEPRTAEVDALMAQKYGLADRLIGLMRDPEQSVAVRLEPSS